MDSYPGYYDFVNIDVEGLNIELLEEMPILPEMVCVEIDPPSRLQYMKDLLANRGYHNMKVIDINLLAWK